MLFGILFFIIFLVLGTYLLWQYALGKEKFSLMYLMLGIWSLSISVAQLKLSFYENDWTLKFIILLVLFFAVFILSYQLTKKKVAIKIAESEMVRMIGRRAPLIILWVLTGISILANIYLYMRFGTLPLFSSLPDQMRFIINREVFGLWEYASLLPRLIIPFSFVYLLLLDNPAKSHKWLIWLNIFVGFIILSLYSSRLVIVLPILLAYFSYLYIKKSTLTKKRIAASGFVILIILAIIAVSIPAFRNYITYKDYYSDVEYTPFTYLADLADADMPKSLEWVVGLYLIPTFNLQAMMRATDYYSLDNYYWGAYGLSSFKAAADIVNVPWFDVSVPWKEIFLPWWVTATILFSFWVDFGWAGIVLGGVFLGFILSYLYQYATKKPSYFSVILVSYFSFVIVMSIYTNYMLREEFYLDVVFIAMVSYLMMKKKKEVISVQ